MTPLIKDVTPIITAAGRGVRMQSLKTKTLFRIGGKPILEHTLISLRHTFCQPPIVVLSPSSSTLKELVRHYNGNFLIQPEPTGNAKALELVLQNYSVTSPSVFVVNGDDSYLYSVQTLKNFAANFNSKLLEVSFITTHPLKPYPNVRKVIRDAGNNFTALEYSDIYNEVVCGCYLFNTAWVKKHLPLLSPKPPKGEYLIVDLLTMAASTHAKIEPFLLTNPTEWWGINTREDLMFARKLWKKQHPE